MSVAITDAVNERVHKWLGEVPQDWAGARLLEVANAWTSNADKHTVEGQLPVRLCNYVDVYKNDAIVGSLEFMTASATRDQIQKFRVRLGDTLITKDSETADDIGVPAFVEYEADDLICGYHLAIVRPDDRRIVPKFLYWVLSSEPIARQWSVTASGVTRVGIRSTDLNKVTIPLPPLDEQRAIADYLDHETAQIDALVAKQVEFIGLLQERRQAFVRIATGWGQPLPNDWTTVRLSHLFTSTGSGTTPANEEILDAANGDVAWVTTGELRERQIELTQRAVSSLTLKKYSALKVYPAGTLLIAMYGATIGRTGLLGIPAATNQACCALVGPVGISAEFVEHSLIAAREWLLLEASGGGQPNINQDKVRAFRIPVPPLDKQQAIVSHIDKQTTRIDALIAKADEHIALAKERRSALITAAVTGQFDVRTAKKGARV